MIAEQLSREQMAAVTKQQQLKVRYEPLSGSSVCSSCHHSLVTTMTPAHMTLSMAVMLRCVAADPAGSSVCGTAEARR